jgi:hypothetical protein
VYQKGGDEMTNRPSASSGLVSEELDAQAVETLPERATMELLGGNLFAVPAGPSDIAGFISQASAASGNAEQTAPIVQGLTAPPQVPMTPMP